MQLLSPCYMALMCATLAKQYYHTNVSIYLYATRYCFISVIAAWFFKNNFAKIKLQFKKKIKMH